MSDQETFEKLAALMQGLEIPPSAINMPAKFFLLTGQAIAKQAKEHPQASHQMCDVCMDFLDS